VAKGIVKRTPALTAYLDSLRQPDDLFGDIQRHVLKKAAQPSGHRHNVIYPSEVVKNNWCMRATFYRITRGPQPRSTSFTRENIFAEGNGTHTKWQAWLSEMGRLEGEWRCRRCSHQFYAFAPTACPQCTSMYFDYREIRFNAPDLMLGGRCDGYCPNDKCLIEIKTMGLGGLRYEQPNFVARYEMATEKGTVVDLMRLWKDFRRPLPSAVKQGNLYLYLAREYAGLDVSKILFIYDFKATQESKAFSVAYDDDLARSIVALIRRMADCVTTGTIPDCSISYTNGCPDCRPYEEAAS
jgi:hypothetical protein